MSIRNRRKNWRTHTLASLQTTSTGVACSQCDKLHLLLSKDMLYWTLYHSLFYRHLHQLSLNALKYEKHLCLSILVAYCNISYLFLCFDSSPSKLILIHVLLESIQFMLGYQKEDQHLLFLHCSHRVWHHGGSRFTWMRYA